MLEESIANSSPTLGFIARKTCKTLTISDPDAGGCVATIHDSWRDPTSDVGFP